MIPLLLLAVQAAQPAPAAPQVFLDHVYVVVDSATYHAMASSPFLRDRLARFGERTNRSGAESWTALGVGGERTYLEVFRVGDRHPRVGMTGIAFSVGAPGGLDALSSSLASLPDATVHRTARTGVMGGREMAWYRSLRVERQSVAEPAVSRWVMEYERPFREALMGDSADHVTGPDVRRWLRSRRYDPSRPLRDITGITLALPADDAAALRAELEAYGLAVADGEVGYSARGPDLEVRVVVSTGRPGVRAVWLRLDGADRDVPEQVFAGGSTLRVVDDTTAVWMFDPGPPERAGSPTATPTPSSATAGASSTATRWPGGRPRSRGRRPSAEPARKSTCARGAGLRPTHPAAAPRSAARWRR